ncbi:MAG: M28 family peptidase [Euryarchaeota archaeon]|nr:M28 family peptidase [Euryarchaeota archaeon]
MTRPFMTILTLLSLFAFVSGCVADDEPTPVLEPVEPDLVPEMATTAFDSLVLPDLDALPDMGKEARLWIKHYAQVYANRISFTPINDGANHYLYDELDKLGYETRLIEYGPEAIGSSSPLTYKVIEGRRAGAVEPEKHIGLIAHHDARYSSNEAAYDDASGTAVVLALAKYFAEVDTRKSVVALFFDGEELGLKSSCYYVNDLARNGGYDYDIAFGYDMVGINWPGHEWGMHLMMGDEDDIPTLLPMAEHVFRTTYDLPEDGVVILDEHDRNSDERRFREAGFPIFRWAGGRHAADYPHYHQPTDTYDTMIDYAGGEENFEQGINAVIQTSIAMFHAADQWDFPDYTPVEQECSFYGPDEGPI